MTPEAGDSKLGTASGRVGGLHEFEEGHGVGVTVGGHRPVEAFERAQGSGIAPTGKAGHRSFEGGAPPRRVFSEPAEGTGGNEGQVPQGRQGTAPEPGVPPSLVVPIGSGTPVLPARSHRHLPVWDSRRRRRGERRMRSCDGKAEMTLLHVTGARPNFPKAAPVIAALAARGARQRLVHTGQHYDDRMSEIFFRELDLPRPDVNLGVGSGSHAEQTAAILVGLEAEMLATRPDMVIVYGDVNSTLAAAIAASKLQIPVAHVEAGLRSFDMTMPEEINRLVTDRLSDLLLCTSPDAIAHLAHEGVPADRIHLVGNPMIDTLLANLHRLDSQAARAALGLPEDYLVATLHRPGNVDDPESAAELVGLVHSAAARAEIVLPLHPRGRRVLEALGIGDHPRVHVVEPLGYLEFMSLVRGSRAVITDSGGVQEETTILKVPCLTLRPNTERPVTITHGTNRLATPSTLIDLLDQALAEPVDEDRQPPLWDGHAGERIADVIMDWLDERSHE